MRSLTPVLLASFYGCCSCLFPTSLGWTSQPSSRVRRVQLPTTTRTVSQQKQQRLPSPVILRDASEGEQESEVELKRRMAMVRSLQMSYYKSNSFTHSSYKKGMIYNLPLWRVGWT